MGNGRSAFCSQRGTVKCRLQLLLNFYSRVIGRANVCIINVVHVHAYFQTSSISTLFSDLYVITNFVVNVPTHA